MNKQIEERHDLTEIIYMSGYGLLREDCTCLAEQIQEQGYRRQSEVAREILDTIYTILNTFYIDNHLNCFPAHFPEGLHPLGKLELAKSFGDALHLKLKELKKKYGVTEE